MKKRPVREQTWQRVYKIESLTTQENHCKYCHEPLKIKSSTADHIVPRSKGGITKKENIVACCNHCNQTKKSLSESKFTSLIKGPLPNSDFDMMLIWMRRKIFLKTEKVCKYMLEVCR